MIYLPSLGKRPSYNFVYATGNLYYYGGGGYTVENGHIVELPKIPDPTGIYKNQNATVHFYLHDVTQNKSTELTWAEAQGYNLDPSMISEDGYKVERGNYSGDFLFGSSRDYNNWYIKGHNRSTKLNLKASGNAGYYDIQFLGWVK